jgi:hypothetical protein
MFAYHKPLANKHPGIYCTAQYNIPERTQFDLSAVSISAGLCSTRRLIFNVRLYYEPDAYL